MNMNTIFAIAKKTNEKMMMGTINKAVTVNSTASLSSHRRDIWVSSSIQKNPKQLQQRYISSFVSTATNASMLVYMSKLKRMSGVVGALSCITAAVVMLPLEDFEKLDPENDCYHRHLHPR